MLFPSLSSACSLLYFYGFCSSDLFSFCQSESSSRKQKQRALLQSWQISLAKLQQICISVLESNKRVKSELLTFPLLYLISSLIVLIGPAWESKKISNANYKLEKYSVSEINLKIIFKRLVLRLMISQLNSLIFPKHSTSTYSVRISSLSKMIPQKFSIFFGVIFLILLQQVNPSGLYSVSVTFLPRATADICLQIGCLSNQYLFFTNQICSFSSSLSQIYFFFRVQRAVHVSCSPFLLVKMF